MSNVPRPSVLIAELTHRCPLSCAYCSNPLELAQTSQELPTSSWLSVLDQAAALGVLQVHFSGGEPLLRDDLPTLVHNATRNGLYATLITGALVGRKKLPKRRLDEIVRSGLRAVQVSFQDVDPDDAKRIAGRDGFSEKVSFCKDVVQTGASLTTNFVLHRFNIGRLEDFIELSLDLAADRIELAHVQYHGWAELNEATLLPTAEQVTRARASAARAKSRYSARAEIVNVMPDLFSSRPKACMSGWGNVAMVIDPTGRALPCHAATSLPLSFDNVVEQSLKQIWFEGDALCAFRGQDWMPSPCRTCPERERDFGGCRCQAFRMTGSAAAADPACAQSPHHPLVRLRHRRAGHEQALNLRKRARRATLRSKEYPHESR